MLRRWKFWRRLIIWLCLIPVLLFSALVGILYWQQDAITQYLVDTLNKDFTGEVVIEGSHISPFANFPYISIDLDHVKIYEDKSRSNKPIMDVEDLYLGFDLWTIIQGDYIIKSLKVKNGHIDLVQHKDGEFNIAKALSPVVKIESPQEEFHMQLKKIDLVNVDITKLNEANGLLVEVDVEDAHASFKTSPKDVFVFLDSRFQMNVVSNGDTTFVKHKHFDVHTKLDYRTLSQVLKIEPSEIILEGATFKMSGLADFRKNMFVDMNFTGEKSNFDLLFAFAPEEMVPLLKKYENEGKIYFNASVKGNTANGLVPKVRVDFGCEKTFVENAETHKKLKELQFKGYFVNGIKRNMSTMEFGLLDLYARPESGIVKGSVVVRNFESPEVSMKLDTEFDLQFLAKFFGLAQLQNLDGKINLTTNFDQLVDIDLPETSLRELKKGVDSELKITNLRFKIHGVPYAVKDIDMSAVMVGKKVSIDYLRMQVGQSDLSVSGHIDDLPAIINHTDIPVTADLHIKSKKLDIHELTSTKKNNDPVDEQIENLNLKLLFKTTARNFTESKNLPVGEFFIEDFYAKLKHYPHTFHDFHADMFITDERFKLVDFSGMIDHSDFHFSGSLTNYALFLHGHSTGETILEYDLVSHKLMFEDLFSYKGANYVPKDYRHEELKELKLHGKTELHFNDGLKSSDTYLTRLDALAKSHHFKLEHFNGRIHYENEHLLVEDFSGKIGKSKFKIGMAYYTGKDKSIRKRDNHFTIYADHLDIDELSMYQAAPNKNEPAKVDHEAGFNIYQLPFTDMTIDADIKYLKYHTYLINNFHAKMRMQENHYVYIDTLLMHAAGGDFRIAGYFNGSNPDKIYFSPRIKIDHVDLDKLMLKFENFGQDHLVSENLHGSLTGKISGKIHMHRDMVPIMDDSELHLDIDVRNGKLANYAPITAMADYFQDKSLKEVRFDTLRNKLDLKNGLLTIPAMTINSTLGFLEISGKQHINMNYEYYVRVPLKMVTSVAFSTLFGKRKEDVENSGQSDEIIYRDKSKNTKFVNLKITGNAETYKISTGKDKAGKRD